MEKYKINNKVKSAWLSSIPNTWKVEKLRAIFTERKEKNSPVKTTNVLSLTNTSGVIPYEQKGNVGNKSKENLEDYHLAHPNDIVLNSMNVVIGSVGLSKYYGAISPVYYALKLNDDKLYNIKYFDYVFKCKSFQKSLKCIGNGILEIRMRIPMQKLKYELLPVPPRKEQDQIVKFLDWKISNINRQIFLYKNKITDIEKLKFSAIRDILFTSSKCSVYKKVQGEWFVKIPSNWNITKVKRHFKVMNGSDPISNGDIPVYGSGSKSFRTCGEYKEPPAVLLGRKGTINKPQYINNKYWNVDTAFDVKPYKDDYELKYFYYCSFYFNYDYYVTKTALPSMTQTDYKNITLPYPDLCEQNSIVSKIELYEEKYNKSIEIVRKQLDVLKELKDKLIYDVVTGQINVQDIKIPKFEYFEENVSDATEDEKIEETEE